MLYTHAHGLHLVRVPQFVVVIVLYVNLFSYLFIHTTIRSSYYSKLHLTLPLLYPDSGLATYLLARRGGAYLSVAKLHYSGQSAGSGKGTRLKVLVPFVVFGHR